MGYLSCFFLLLYLLTVLIQLYFLKFRAVGRSGFFLSEENLTKKLSEEQLSKVSIIICAKNEAKNLSKNLPFVLQQNYPAALWEVVVVDDASNDDSSEILASFQKQFSHLKIIAVSKNAARDFPGKKQALHEGIKAANFDLVLLTDADCRPVSDHWLFLFALKQKQTQKSILLGYGGYERQLTFLNKLVQWETLQTCIQYAGMCLSQMPYMGVGRNLMYAKALYFQALQDEAFKATYAALPSGDDDLLISKIANSGNTALCLEQEAHTLSQPPTTYRQWFRQKTRHVSTGKYYPQKIKYLLGLLAFSQGLFWLMWLIICVVLLVSCFNTMEHFKPWVWQTSFLLGLIRIILYWKNAKKWYSILNAKKLVSSYPIGEICLSVFQLILSPFIFWKNKQQWK